MGQIVTFVEKVFSNDFDTQNRVVNVKLLKYKDSWGCLEGKWLFFILVNLCIDFYV